MAEILTSLNNNVRSRKYQENPDDIKTVSVTHDYEELPSPPAPKSTQDGPAVPGRDGTASRWSVGRRSATHTCVCGSIFTYELDYHGQPIGYSRCCIHAAPFPNS